MFAITRYNLDNKGEYKLYNNILCSQDVWVLKVPIKIPEKSNFYFGILGCDNYFAYLMKNEGYNVLNPCKFVKTYHHHSSNIRNYLITDSVFKKDEEQEKSYYPYCLKTLAKLRPIY
jgi:hypothetical protein